MTLLLDLLAVWAAILAVIVSFGFLVGLEPSDTEHVEKDLKNDKKADITFSDKLEHTSQIIITDIPNNWSPSEELFGRVTKKNVNR